MLFDVFPGGNFRNLQIARYGKKHTTEPVGTIEILQTDEAVSIGRIIRRRTFDTIAAYQYAVVQPEPEEQN